MIRKFLQFLAFCLIHKQWKMLYPSLIKEYRKYISFNEFNLLNAQMLLVSGEDHRFFSHIGFDLIAIFRAIYRRLIYGKIEGASTIEQQIVRVLTGKYQRTIKRKIEEILLAILVSREISKDDLPGLYLHLGYYGWGMNNLSQACRHLKINTKAMSLREAASLVARLKYPEPYRLLPIRKAQIDRRIDHLMKLHFNHSSTTIYNGFSWRVIHATI